jgi:uncharacterized coiled-coil protein SlyX
MKKWLSKQLVNWLLPDINQRIEQKVFKETNPLVVHIAEQQNDIKLLQIKLNVLTAMLSTNEPDAKQAENSNQA